MTQFIAQWYWLIFMLAGFLCGVYISSARIRHFINTLAIMLLRHTDSYYEPDVIIRERVREKVVEKPVFIKDFSGKKTGIPLTQEELDRMMERNPDIKVGERKTP